MGSTDVRISPTETRYDVADVRSFILGALNTEPAVEQLEELMVCHVEGNALHPEVVPESLVGIIGDIVGAAPTEDWTAITTRLISEAREALLDDEPEAVCTG
jgi:hypothetical protein